MTVYLTDRHGDRWRVQHVETVRLVGKTTVELKTFGNAPALTRNIATFEVVYDSATVLDKAV
jgi:hypothetical protein